MDISSGSGTAAYNPGLSATAHLNDSKIETDGSFEPL
jgi:hypothetical protein